jgi:hypothetical protein
MPQRFVRNHPTALRVFDISRLAGGVRRPPPVPAPPKPAPVPTLIYPALYIIEEYQLITVPGDVGVTRNVVGTINITGNSRKTIYVRTKRAEAKSGTISQTVFESRDQSVSKNLSQSISSSSEQSQSRDQSNFKFDASFHGEVDVGLTGGSADADAHASTDSREVRDAFKDAVAKATNDQIASTAEFRTQTSASVSESQTTVSEGESIETFEIDNTNNPQAQNYLLCQLAIERLTALCLVNAKVGFFDASTGQSVLRPLSGLISLVNGVVVAEHQHEVLDALLKQMTTVFDYQDQPRTFVRKADSGAGELFQVVPNLTTEIKLSRPDGSARSFTVPGIATKIYDNILPIPQIGLARGSV